MQVFKSILSIFAIFTLAKGWAFPNPFKAQQIGRKAFLAGAATGLVIGAGVAGAVVAVDQAQNNRKSPYEPSSTSLDGKVIIITGGSSGLGLESAKRLSKAGATIVLTSRNLSKGENAVEEIKRYLASSGVNTIPKIYNLVLDLDDLDSVKSFPSSYTQLGLGKIDVLLNNAGVMAIPNLQLTKDGFERTFQSNHLGHFVLTSTLYPYLNRDKSVVVNVSSEAYTIAMRNGLELDNLNGEKQFGAWTSYGQSKLANILFTQELQRKADAIGDSWLTAVTLHPGAVRTDLGRYVVGEEKWNELRTNGPSGLESVLLNAASLFTKTVKEGASTQVFLASGAEGALKKGAYYNDLQVQNLPSFAKDEYKAKLLWERSEELAGIKFCFENSSSVGKSSPITTVSAASEQE